MEPLGRLRMGMSYFTVSLWVFGLMSMPEALGFRVEGLGSHAFVTTTVLDRKLDNGWWN